MTANYTDVFGADTVPPSQYGYQAITLSASQSFNWPTSGTADLIAAIMDVSATVGGLTMNLPPADEVSAGQDILIRNSGANSFTVQDADSVPIATISAGSVAYFYVADNTSPAGTWGYVTFGVGTSSIDAATLIGYGIKAIGSTLNQSHPILDTAIGITVGSTHRAQVINYTGGVDTLAFSQASTLGDDFFTLIRNSGSGTLTLNPYSTELIDGISSLEIQPGESLLVFCSGLAWYTVGYGRSVIYNFTQLVKDVSGGGTFTLTASEASNKLLTFIGNPAAGVTIVVPNTVAVYYILNSLSTAQSVTVKTSLGTGVAVPQTQRVIAISDSTNVYSAQSVGVSSALSMLDGSVSAPALNFSSQTNTGFYKYGTSGMGVAIVGADLVHIETTGTTFSGTSPIVSTKIGPVTAQQHTLPAVASDTVALLAAAQTFTNKTIVAANNTITTAASGSLSATSLNAALAELESEKAPLNSPTFTGIVGGVAASMVVNTPAGNISATTVQSALNELDSEKQVAVAPGTSGNVLTSNGASWISAAPSGVPAGTIIDYAGTSAPPGYLLCPTALPAAISATTYSALALAIGGTWGAGTTTVNAGSFVIGNTYVIKVVGTTDFMAIGATSNTVGLAFTCAVSSGSGSGSAYSDFVIPWFAADYVGVQANANVGTASTGTVKAHTHTGFDQSAGAMTAGGAVGTPFGVTGSTGGAANLAAGVRVLKCVKY